MTRVGFGSTELHPFVRGGAGVLIASVAAQLRCEGLEAETVLGSPEAPPESPFVYPAPQATAPGWDLPFMDVSMGVAEGLAARHAEQPFDLVEIQDFDGLAFWLLTHRRDLGFGETPIVVRVHGPVDLQAEAMGVDSRLFSALAAMERESYRMADAVLAPSPGLANLAVERYGLEQERVVVAPPPVRTLDPATRWMSGGSDLLVVGRLSEVKGSLDMVHASLPVLDAHPEATVTFVGADGWSASFDRPMRDVLVEAIPPQVADQVRFIDHADSESLAQLMASSAAVVAPSRFESFNLAVHEARAIGAPVVVPDLPAFSGLVDAAHGAMVYDATIGGLSETLGRVLDHPDHAERLAAMPPPEVGDPVAAYRRSYAVRHVRSQGGVSTAGLARVEEAWFSQEPPGTTSMVNRTLSGTPNWLLALLKPIVPKRLKEKLRSDTEWNRIEEVRRWQQRWDDALASLAADPPPPTPRTVFVVPCYNQGSFVRQALISVAEQTDRSWEVVVVDDGSDEPETLAVLDAIAMPGVRLLRQENRGLAAARNAGIDASSAEFIVPLDADDLVEPTYLETLVGALDVAPQAGYAHCWARLFGDFDAVWATRPVNPYQLTLSNSVVGCVVMRREAVHAVGGYDESMRSGNEDWDLWIRMGAAGFHGTQVREVLFWYRKHGVSMSVETEARYEDAVDDLATRLPAVYAAPVMRARKQEFYPLLTVIAEGAALRWEGPDVQVLSYTDDPTEVVDQVAGKYVTVASHDATGDLEALVVACRELEDNPDAGVARTVGSEPGSVLRRWSWCDTDGPTGEISVDASFTSAVALEPGGAPQADLSVPSTIDGFDVIRQRPEESGFLPDWIS